MAIHYELEADVLEGLEDIARAELNERLGSRASAIELSRPGALYFRYSGDLRALLGLKSIVAVAQVLHFAVPRPRALLGHQHFEALLKQIEIARKLHPAGAFRTFYLSAAGEESSVLVRFKNELAERTGLSVAPDEGDLLIRLRRAPRQAGWEVLVRLSPRPLATRAWRVCNMPGAPNATLAHAVMRLSQPAPDDTVLNVACGSGTLLIERLALGKVRSAIGCDTDLAALECARANLEAAGFGAMARLEAWDATLLPINTASISVICADLPFGQLVGSHRENEQLYPRLIGEAARVAAPGARMVLLTHEVRLLERVAAQYAEEWHVEQAVRVRSGGMAPRIFVFRRK